MTDKEMTKFVRLYGEKRSLWDPLAYGYRDRARRSRLLSEISALMELPGFGPREAATKIKNLRTTFKQEEKKMHKSREAGGNYMPKLRWYGMVASFLSPNNPNRRTSEGQRVDLVNLDSNDEDEDLFEYSTEINSDGVVWVKDGQVSSVTSSVGGWKGVSDEVDEDYDGSPPPSPPHEDPLAIRPEDPLAIRPEVPPPIRNGTPPIRQDTSLRPVDSPKVLEDPLAIRSEPINIRSEPINIRLEPINIRSEPINIRSEPINIRSKTIDIRSDGPEMQDDPMGETDTPSRQSVATREPDEFDYFAKSLAVQLRAMPLDRGLACMERLQAVVREERLAILSEEKDLQEQAQAPVRSRNIKLEGICKMKNI